MDTVNIIAAKAFRYLLTPFEWLGLGGSLAGLSLCFGVAMVLALKKFGNREARELAHRRMYAHLMEVRLYDREPRVVARAFMGFLRWNARYLSAHLKPLLIVSIPATVLMLKMESYYGFRPIVVDEPVLLMVKGLDPRALEGLVLEGSAGLAIETPPVRSLVDSTASWRVRARREGDWAVRVTAMEQVYDKVITVSSAPALLSRIRTQDSWSGLLYANEPNLPAGPVASIEVRYPARGIRFFGFETHWLVWMLGISLLGAVAFRTAVKQRLG